MKAYQQKDIEHTFLQEKAENWFEKGFLTQAQLDAIKQEFPLDYYQPNFFLRIALFLFMSLVCTFSIAILWLIFEKAIQQSPTLTLSILSFAFGVGLVAVLEHFIKYQKMFYAGTDNALLYYGIASFSTAILTAFDAQHLPTWLALLLILPVFLLAIVRYADSLTVCGTYIISLAIVFDASLSFSAGKTLLPFIIMLFSLGIYRLSEKLRKRKDVLYYANVLDILKTLSLTTFYLGGNYFIVREGNALVNKIYTGSTQIALAPLFYFFSVMIPILYVVGGLKKKDRLLLFMGLLCAAFSVFTYRHYFGFLPTEIALIISGTLLIVVCAGLIYYLKTPKFGFTYNPESERDGISLESILLSEIIQTKLDTDEKTFRFGGGTSGGGGAGGEY